MPCGLILWAFQLKREVFMFKRICYSIALLAVAISSFLSAQIEYEIYDIGTLQTRSSQAIALNNQGQILGWYNIEKTDTGKQFFVRNRDGVFYELPSKEPGSSLAINWQYLTDSGKAYGTFDTNASTLSLCVWDQQNGFVKLGVLPWKELIAVNNEGQVLLQSLNEDGKSIQRPIIWKNGQITKLKGLSGDLGIESESSYGYSMNNKGEVVGKSLVSLSYKNEIYQQWHAVKWTDGQVIDLHKMVPKSSNSCAKSLNDIGDIFIDRYLICNDGKMILFNLNNLKTTNREYLYDLDKSGNSGVYDKNGNTLIDNSAIANKVYYDTDSIWMNVIGIVSANDNGEVIAQAKTIYGEEHAMFLVPKKN